MELIASIPVFGGFLATVIPFIVILGVVVFVHEYGHYIVGRWSGIHAEVFSVGYGRPIWSWHDKRGTKWQIAWLPLGGYVKFLGDGNAASFNDSSNTGSIAQEDQGRAFPTASVGARAATVAAGPFFNFILSAVVFTGIALYVGVPTQIPTNGELRMPIEEPYDLQVDDEILAVNGSDVEDFAGVFAELEKMETHGDVALTVRRDGAELDVVSPYFYPPLVGGLSPLSAATKADIEIGDLFVNVDGKDVASFEDLRDIVLASDGRALPYTLLRDGALVNGSITPQVVDYPKEEGGFERRIMIGVQSANLFSSKTEAAPFFPTLWRGTVQVWDVIVASLDGLKHIVRGVFGAEDGLGADNLQGPLGIAQISGESAKQGWIYYIQLIALLSTAIGMLNLFPIPILDGGHLVIFAYEAIAGRQPSDRVLNVAMSIGLVLLLALMLFATYNDIVRMIT